MAFDGIVLHSITHELQALLLNNKLDKIQQPLANMLVFTFRGNNGSNRLLISTHGTYSRLHLTKARVFNPLQAPLFCMVLRKHFEGGRLISIVQNGLDRMITFTLETNNELGFKEQKSIIIELIGKYSNIIAVNQQNIIIDCLTKVSIKVNRYRELLPGLPYTPPPLAAKISFVLLTEEDFSQQLLLASSDTPCGNIYRNRFQGISSQLSQKLCVLAGFSPQASLGEHLGSSEIHQFYLPLQHLSTSLQLEKYQPCLIKEHDKIQDYYCLDFLYPSGNLITQSSMNDAIEYFYSSITLQQQLNKEKISLAQVLQNQQQKKKQKLVIYEAILQDGTNMEQLKNSGDLLLSNLYQFKKGMTEIIVEDYYHTNEPLTITLLPHKNPQENIQEYYRRYGKKKKAVIYARQNFDELEREIALLDELAVYLDNSDDLENIQEIKQELIKLGLVKLSSKGKQKQQSIPSKPYQWAISADLTIFIGKNSKQNENLTCKYAKPYDLWLHTKNSPGSHVIIHKNSEKAIISDSVLTIASSLAAYYSKQKNNSKVDVDYTEIKNIKKPPNSPLGLVHYDKYQTIFAEPKSLSELQRALND
ncbi:MAG: NFACT RNA binding domain-containing protein [Clostridia bacterium]